MPEQEPSVTDPTVPDVVQMAHRLYRDGRDHSSDWRLEAREAYDMVAGHQWEQSDLMVLKEQQRPAVVFNRILRTVNAVAGTQVANRQETRFIPREQGDVKVNEIISAAGKWVRDETDAEDEESDAFEDMCISGMGWTETRMDYQSEPDGMARIERVDPIEMYWDPAATKRNLSDARWVLHIKLLTMDEFAEQWPDADVDLVMSPWEEVDDEVSKRTHVYPQDAYRQEQARRGSKGAKGVAKIRVGHLQWAEAVESYRVGKSAKSLPKRMFDKLRPKLEQEKVPFLKQKAVRWKQAFVAGGTVLDEGDCPYPDGPTLKCMTYRRDRNKNTWFGLVKAMIDPQRFGNKFFSQILDILNKGAKGGIMAESDAVDDPRDLESKWARPDSVIWTRPGAISGNKIREKPLVELPAQLDRLMGFSLDAVHEVMGINLELLGFANRNQPGVLEQQRKQAGLTILAPLFDSMRRYRKEQGRVLLHFIQKYLSDGRLIRIVGNDGNEKYIKLAKQSETARYDVIVDESPTSPNMKEKVYASLVDMLPALSKMGIPLPPELLDYAPIPSVLASKWKELIQKGGGGPSPEDVKKMTGEMQRLAQENTQLKDKTQEAQANFALKQQEAAADADNAREQIRIKREEAEEKIAIKRKEVDADIELAWAKANAEIGIAAAKVKADTEAPMKAIEDAVQSISIAQPTRRLTVHRDADGFIAGADIEDVDMASVEPEGNA